jgi:hypothetical protein
MEEKFHVLHRIITYRGQKTLAVVFGVSVGVKHNQYSADPTALKEIHSSFHKELFANIAKCPRRLAEGLEENLSEESLHGQHYCSRRSMMCLVMNSTRNYLRELTSSAGLACRRIKILH